MGMITINTMESKYSLSLLYFIKGPLIKWGFKESSLIYLFIRKMRQTGIIENKVLDQYNMDVTRGIVGVTKYIIMIFFCVFQV